jgi:membrane protein implicated in regulation of membrane protease activity
MDNTTVHESYSMLVWALALLTISFAALVIVKVIMKRRSLEKSSSEGNDLKMDGKSPLV